MQSNSRCGDHTDYIDSLAHVKYSIPSPHAEFVCLASAFHATPWAFGLGHLLSEDCVNSIGYEDYVTKFDDNFTVADVPSNYADAVVTCADATESCGYYDIDYDKRMHECCGTYDIDYGKRVHEYMCNLDDKTFSLEPPVHMYAARTKPAAKPKTKRAGAKATKKIERLMSKGHELDPEEATAYRALAARANYLAQDRPDISFASKELCREFAVPNKNSFYQAETLSALPLWVISTCVRVPILG